MTLSQSKDTPASSRNRLKGIYLSYKTRGIKKLLFILIAKYTRFCIPIRKVTSADRIAMDIVIPCIAKDLSTLSQTIHYLKKNLQHEIKKIHIICPSHQIELFKEFSSVASLHTDDEVSPFPSEKKIRYKVNNQDRSGWLLQQFIKLNSDEIAETEHFLIFDSDTLLIKPTLYFSKGKCIFYFSDECHPPYFKMIRHFFPKIKLFSASFIAHGMLFNKSALKQLKQEIEKKAQNYWCEAILEKCDLSLNSCFSEYELYGNFFYNNFKANFLSEYWCNKNFERHEIENFNPEHCARWVRTASFHDHFKETTK